MLKLSERVGVGHHGPLLPSIFLRRVALPCDEEFDDSTPLALCNDAIDDVLCVAVAVCSDRWRWSIILLRSTREQTATVAIRLQLVDVEGRMQRLELWR